MSMSKEQTVQIIDIALAAIGVLPSLINQVKSLFELRGKVERDEVTQADLDAVMAELEGRSKLIQAS